MTETTIKKHIPFGEPISPDTAQGGFGFIPNGIREKNIFFYHPDHLGSSSYITGHDGKVSQHTEYIAFGEILFDEHNTEHTMPYLFNGKELDQETGLYYYGARYLDSKTSLWLNVDPLAEKYPNWNSYIYTFQNPINLIDPTGMEGEDPIGSGYYSASINSRYIGFGLRHPIASLRIGFGVTKGASNISTNATRFATRGEILHGSKRGQIDEGSENGAFRHTLWQASITSEFSRKIAKEAGNAHEQNPFTNLNIRSFKKLSDADQTVDMLNNIIGRNIGEANKGASMDTLANLVLDEFQNNGLYTASKDNNGNWNISKTKLSSDKYIQLKNIFKELNKNGRTETEQKIADKKAKEEKERWDRGPKW